MPELSRAIKFLGGALPAATVMFGAVGFLSIRSFVNGIGLPEHASLSVDEYLQYGGRVFFSLIFQLLPLAALFAAILILFEHGKKRVSFFLKVSGHPYAPPLFMLALAGVALYYESDLLASRPLFLPWSVRDPHVSQTLKNHFYLAEAASVVSGFWLFASFGERWRSSALHLQRRAVLFLAGVAVSSEILLLCPCFGRIVMVPDSFQRTAVRRKDAQVLQGLLLFSDKDNYFLLTTDCMIVEVPHGEVKQIDYDVQQKAGDACKK